MYVYTCAICSKQFTNERQNRKFCSQICYQKNREINGSPKTSEMKGACIDCKLPISIRRKRCELCCRKYFSTARSRYKMTTETHCRDCGIEKTIDNTFFADGQSSTKCRKCSNKIKTASQKKIKKECVDYKGGKCQRCGYKKCLGALHFHHLDPTQKEFTIARYKSSVLNDKIKTELDKCILLCANCHAEEHDLDVQFSEVTDKFKLSMKSYIEEEVSSSVKAVFDQYVEIC